MHFFAYHENPFIMKIMVQRLRYCLFSTNETTAKYEFPNR
jgi:hypothetical protein